MPGLLSRILIVTFLLLTATTGITQVLPEADLHTIKGLEFGKNRFDERKVRFGFGRGAWLSNIFFAPPLYIYQKFLSTQISAGCLYHPSCSEFSREAFSRFSIPKALLSSMDRIMRCDRISATDFPRLHPNYTPDHKKIEGTDYYGDL